MRRRITSFMSSIRLLVAPTISVCSSILLLQSVSKFSFLVGYDRHVDYEQRLSEEAAVEISSNESSDSEVQVIDDQVQVTLENPIVDEEINSENALVVESDSDNSEVLFVLALKPPEQRT